MGRNISRRTFVAGTIRLAAVSHLIHVASPEAQAQTASRLGPAERRTLRAAVDDIIPAQGRMPAASAVGAVRYIEGVSGTDQKLRDLLVAGLRAIEAGAAGIGTRFDLVSAARQGDILARIEKADTPAGFFPTLRDLVYEAYYTQPRVMRLIGYNYRSGPRRTASLPTFDDDRLARVRQMRPLYRDVQP